MKSNENEGLFYRKHFAEFNDPNLGTCYTFNHESTDKKFLAVQPGAKWGEDSLKISSTNLYSFTLSFRMLYFVVLKYTVCKIQLLSGLEIGLKLNQSDYVSWTNTAGFRLYIHRRDIQIDATKFAHNLAPETVNNIIVSKVR